ncbi:MAG: tRNA (5-methylaminomethyl-2-thiouridine)(34)-methyltransferase MnmD [Candidatus Woesearchaeota archaeon]
MDTFKTGDESLTFFSDKYQEYYHSKTGALEEGFLKYAIPSKLSSVQKKEISILDICFGVGYNSLAGIIEALKNKNLEKINITAIELDPEILEKIKNNTLKNPEYRLIRELFMEKEVKTCFQQKNFSLKLINDDALIAVKKLEKTYDYVFLDPFSPKKCPELWTEDFFKNIYEKMNSGGILTTYSCARVVRENLKNADFIVEDGPKVYRRGPSTIAKKP